MPLDTPFQRVNHTAIAAGKVANTVIKPDAGIYFGMLFWAAGGSVSFNVQVFDNATTNSGDIVGDESGTTASMILGTLQSLPVGVNCDNGIVVQGSAGNPGMTIFWN